MSKKLPKTDCPSLPLAQIRTAEERFVQLIMKESSILSGGNYKNIDSQAQAFTIKCLLDLRQRLRNIVFEEMSINQARLQIEISIEECKTAMSDLPENQSRYRKVLRDVLETLQTALSSLAQQHPMGRKRSLIIPIETLFKTQSELFPAERMLITSGRHEGQNTTLGVTFDVTGEWSAGHVRADPDKLARGLIAMDKAGAHLKLWSHSHPGTGINATKPSYIDNNQHADWVKDYGSQLVAAIFVRDGYFRLWGDAIKNHKVEIHMIGQGIKRIGNEHIYKFE